MDHPLTKYELDRTTGVGLAALGAALAENAHFGVSAAHSDLIQRSLETHIMDYFRGCLEPVRYKPVLLV